MLCVLFIAFGSYRLIKILFIQAAECIGLVIPVIIDADMFPEVGGYFHISHTLFKSQPSGLGPFNPGLPLHQTFIDDTADMYYDREGDA